MLIASIIIFVLVIAAVIYVFLTMPRVADAADMELQSTDYAHRGLHSKDVPENSLAAFTLARDEGYGIELDVRLSADGQIFVFHDESLSRMCGINKRISNMSAAQIRSVYLKGGRERIPMLSEVLDIIEGRVPLLIEIKSAKNQFELCKRLALLLDTYPGAFAIQSFDPRVLQFFKKYRPRFARGQLVSKIRPSKDKSQGPGRFACFALNHMLTNVLSRPDFVSMDKSCINEPAFLLATKVFKCKGFVWTVRKQNHYTFCRQKGLYVIFENIKPQ